MRAHGDYKIEVIGQIVHVYPIGGFNVQGIQAMHCDIIKAAPRQNGWALFEHPKGEAGLTPDAVHSLIEHYQHLVDMNCCAVALEISSTWRAIFEKLVAEQLTIPILLDGDCQALSQQLTEAIANH